MDRKIVREVPLTDDQFDRLDTDARTQAMATDVLASLVMEIAEKRAKLKKEFFAAVRQLAEVGERQDVAVNWLKRCIEVYERESVD